MLSRDKKTQSGAVLELFGKIWRHGMVCEATAKAVPFLCEILEIPACSERFSILWLLGAISNGSSYHQTRQPEKKNEMEREMIWVKNARDEIRRGVKMVLGLLNQEYKELLLPVVLLLSSLTEEAAQITPKLSLILSAEKNPEARAGLGLALALLGGFHGGAFQSENSKLDLPRIEALAKVCASGEETKVEARLMIEECLLSTMARQDRDWLFDKNNWDGINLNCGAAARLKGPA